MWVTCKHRIQLFDSYSLALNPRRPAFYTMSAPEPPNVESHSTQSSTRTKPSGSDPNGCNLPAPAKPSLVLLLCLISGAVPQGERASLIEATFSGRKVTEMVRCLRGCDAQTFIDVVDEVRYRSSLPGDGLLTFLSLLGVGKPRPCARDPKEMPEVTVQDVRWPYPTSQITAGRVTRQSNRSPVVWWWVWRCVEARIPGAGGRGQGLEEICQQ